MASLKKRAKEFETPYPVTKAITKGDAVTKLSMLVMGLGNLAHKQIVKGILFLAVEIAYLLFMIEGGINNLYHLITLAAVRRKRCGTRPRVFMNIPAAI